MLLCSPAGNDLMFDESYCKQGSNFANKIWNAFKLVKGWEVDEQLANPNQVAIEWFDSRFNQALTEIEDNFKQYRLSEALMVTYKLVWDDFCALYLEMIKPANYHTIDPETMKATMKFFENILKILHPFMPFITEELWHDELFGGRSAFDCCIVAQLPINGKFNTQLLEEIELVNQIVTQIKKIKNTKQIPQKEKVSLIIKPNSQVKYGDYDLIIKKMAVLNSIEISSEKIAGALSFMISTDEFYVPLNENPDSGEEKARLIKDKEYLTGFLNAVNSKLSNERFMVNAKPEIIDIEVKKKTDAEAKLKIIEDNLLSLAI